MMEIKSLRLAFVCLSYFVGCHVGAADWQFAGMNLAANESYIVLFDAGSVQRKHGDTIRFWIESIRKIELDRIYKAHGKAAIDASAAKIAKYYVPLWWIYHEIPEAHTSLTDEENPIIPTIMYEVAGNFPGRKASTSALIELNCKERTSRSLQVTVFRRDGTVQSQSTAVGASSYAAPDSNADGWLKTLCQASPT